MTAVCGFLLAFVLFLGVGSAHAQLPQGPSLVTQKCDAQLTGLQPFPACQIVILLPNNPNYACTFFVNVKTFQQLDLPVDVFLNPNGADCIPPQPGQGGPTQVVPLSRPTPGEGAIYFTAASQLNPPSQAPFTAASGRGVLADISNCRFFNVAVCPLEAITGPIAGCPKACNDVTQGEFPDPFPNQ